MTKMSADGDRSFVKKCDIFSRGNKYLVIGPSTWENARLVPLIKTNQ